MLICLQIEFIELFLINNHFIKLIAFQSFTQRILYITNKPCLEKKILQKFHYFLIYPLKFEPQVTVLTMSTCSLYQHQ